MDAEQNVYNNGTRFVLPRFQQNSYSLPHISQTLNSTFLTRPPSSNQPPGNINQLRGPSIPTAVPTSTSISGSYMLPCHRSNSISVLNGQNAVTGNSQLQLNHPSINTGSVSSIVSSSTLSTNNSSSTPAFALAGTSVSPNPGLYPTVPNQQFFPSTPAQTPSFNTNYSLGSPRTLESSFGLPGTNDIDKFNSSHFLTHKKRDVKNLNTPKSIALKFKDMPLQQYAKVVKDAELKSMKLNPQLHAKSTIQSIEQMRERERQIFALIWLLQNCSNKEPSSYVPRGQIFEQYSIVCDQFDLKPLSQASLGKLIRTVFPNLTTRRLGMRGRSKYHYCGLKLLKVIEVPTKFKNNDDEYDDEKSNHSSVQSSPRSSSFLENHNVKTELTLLEQSIDTEKVEQLKKNCVLDGTQVFSSHSDGNILNHATLPSMSQILKLDFITLERKYELDMFEKKYNTYCTKFIEYFKELNFDQMANIVNLENPSIDNEMNLDKFLSLMNCDTIASVWASVMDVITFSSLLKWLAYHLKTKLLIENDTSALKSLSKFVGRIKEFFNKTITKKNYIFAHRFKIYKDFFRIIDVLLNKFEFLTKLNADFVCAQRKMRASWKNNVEPDKFIPEIENWTDLDENSRQMTLKTLLGGLDKLTEENVPLVTLFDSMGGTVHSLLYPHIVNKNSDAVKKTETLISHFFEKVIGIISLRCPEALPEWVYYANISIQLSNFCSKLSQFVVEYFP